MELKTARDETEFYKVYKYTFPNGKIYIGVTKNTIQYRNNCGYQHNKPLRQAIRSIGFANVTKEILYESADKLEAFNKEKEYISLLRSDDPSIGFNISKGGISTFEGLKHTKAHREKMSALYMGRTFSDETLKRMKMSHAKERKAVLRISGDGNVIERYESLGDAASAVGGFKSNISRACRIGKKYKNFLWKFA